MEQVENLAMKYFNIRKFINNEHHDSTRTRFFWHETEHGYFKRRGIFSRRFSSEKSPAITVANFFLFSVRLQSHSDWSTFLTTETTKTTKAIRQSPVSGS